MNTKSIKCIKCGYEIEFMKYNDCPWCNLPVTESNKYYRKLNNERLIKMHPNKKLPIGFYAYCPNCSNLENINSDEKSKHIGCTVCSEGELFSIPINQEIYSKLSIDQLKQVNIVLKNAFNLYPDDRKPISMNEEGLYIYSEKSDNLKVRGQYIIDNLKKIVSQKQTSKVTTPRVKCPYCQSLDTNKISTLSKVVNTALFGVFSMSRNSKNYHCNKCGSNF